MTEIADLGVQCTPTPRRASAPPQPPPAFSWRRRIPKLARASCWLVSERYATVAGIFYASSLLPSTVETFAPLSLEALLATALQKPGEAGSGE